MLFVVCWLFVVVRCLLAVGCWLIFFSRSLCVVCRALYVVRCAVLPFVVWCVLCAVVVYCA